MRLFKNVVDEIKIQSRDLEAVHQVIMGLKTLNTVRGDKELIGLLNAVERNAMSKYLELRKKVLSSSRIGFVRKFW